MSNWKRIAVTVLAFTLITGTAVAGSPPSGLPSAKDLVPAEWGGVWSIHTETHKCSNDSLLFSSTGLDTICPNTPFPHPSGGGFTCTTTATATAFSSHCTGSEEVVPGCTAGFVFDVSGTRSGDTFTATGTENITYVGSCFGIPNSCTRLVESGTRTAPPPNPCSGSPVAERSWGELKSIYR